MDDKEYREKRDARVYELWKNGKKQSWIAEQINRSHERVRQIVNKAKQEEEDKKSS